MISLLFTSELRKNPVWDLFTEVEKEGSMIHFLILSMNSPIRFDIG